MFNVEQSCKWASRTNLLKDGATMCLDVSYQSLTLECLIVIMENWTNCS